MYDRKIRRISQDDFVALTLRLGDSIVMANKETRPSGFLLPKDFVTEKFSEFPVTFIKAGVDEHLLGDGLSKKSQLLLSGLSALKDKTPFDPIAQKLEDTAWAYCTTVDCQESTGAKSQPAFMLVQFNNKDLIRLMRIKGVGN